MPAAQFLLARLYESGVGVDARLDEPARWYRRAAYRGHGAAAYSLGRMYWNGRGVTEDPAEAYFWLALSAVRLPLGEARTPAQQDRDLAELSLTAAQLADLKRRLADWHKAHAIPTAGLRWDAGLKWENCKSSDRGAEALP